MLGIKEIRLKLWWHDVPWNGSSNAEKCRPIDASRGTLSSRRVQFAKNVSALGLCALFRAAWLFRADGTRSAFRARNIWMTYSASVLERNLLRAGGKKERKRGRKKGKLRTIAWTVFGGDVPFGESSTVEPVRHCRPSPIKPECDLPLILFNELPINEGNSRQRWKRFVIRDLRLSIRRCALFSPFFLLPPNTPPLISPARDISPNHDIPTKWNNY